VRRSGAIAIYSVVAVGLLIFAIVSGVGWLVSRGIAAATDRLGEGAAQFARGNLDHRIDSRSEDELGALAAAFNDMADKRMQADKELKLYSESLEEMVEERTKELGDAQEELVRKEKLSVLGQLAGGVGHELRNPLGVISNAVYYLKMVLPDADDNVKEYLETISTEVDCSTEIISDLLDLSRTRPAQREKVEIFELINQALDKHRSPEEVELTTKIASDLPPVYVDSRQIGQVLHNLVTNAYQAMPEGGKLTISARAEKGRVILSITDTGCGISQENIKKLFEPLFTTRANGIGLGLTVCKNLVETNGGSIEVESKGGKGSTFILLLPINEGVSS
jgi:signal transduction histidine kinase